MRYFLHRPIPWVIVFSELAIVTTAYLAAAWVLKKEGHVFLDIGLNHFEPRKRAAITAFVSLLGAIICLTIAWYGVVTFWFHVQGATVLVEKELELPLAPLLAVIPVGFAMLSIQFLRRSYGYLGEWRGSPKKWERRIEEADVF